jgi:hypothetical protein
MDATRIERQVLERPIMVREGEVLRVEFTQREDGSVLFLRAGAARPDAEPQERVPYINVEG